MFPYKDDNPTLSTPVVTLGLIAANIAAWVLLQGAGREAVLQNSVCHLGLIPGHLFGSVPVGAEVPLGQGVTCTVGDLPGWTSPGAGRLDSRVRVAFWG